MTSDKRTKSRRALLKYALGALGVLAAPGSDVAEIAAGTAGGYRTVERRELQGGGVGLFIAVAPEVSAEGLRQLGEHLRAEFKAQPMVTIEVFDDVEAARTVRQGSRVVGEERFSAARAHQRASYRKNGKTGQHTWTIFGESVETMRY